MLRRTCVSRMMLRRSPVLLASPIAAPGRPFTQEVAYEKDDLEDTGNHAQTENGHLVTWAVAGGSALIFVMYTYEVFIFPFQKRALDPRH
jgi:hypothetical protein